jgi:hypothetical protein
MLKKLITRKSVLVAFSLALTVAFTSAVVPALGGPTAHSSASTKTTAKKALKTANAALAKVNAIKSSAPTPAPVSAATTTSTIVTVATDTKVVGTTLTTTAPSRITANGSLQLLHIMGGNRYVQCKLTVDGMVASTQSSNLFIDGTADTAPVTGGAVVPAGAHTVNAVCSNGGGTGQVDFEEGSLTAIAIPS